MLLSVAERIVLLNVLPPAEGSAVFLRSVRKLRRDLSFTDAELEHWKVRDIGNGGFSWDSSAAVSVDIDISGAARDYVVLCLKKIEALGALNETLLPIFEQLCPEV